MSIGFSVCQTSGEKLCSSVQPKNATAKIASPTTQSRRSAPANNDRRRVDVTTAAATITAATAAIALQRAYGTTSRLASSQSG